MAASLERLAAVFTRLPIARTAVVCTSPAKVALTRNVAALPFDQYPDCVVRT